MSKNDGGYAFPTGYYIGMTLRDWFAGQALSGIAENYNGLGTDLNRTAEIAYRLADAMIRERKSRD